MSPPHKSSEIQPSKGKQPIPPEEYKRILKSLRLRDILLQEASFQAAQGQLDSESSSKKIIVKSAGSDMEVQGRLVVFRHRYALVVREGRRSAVKLNAVFRLELEASDDATAALVNDDFFEIYRRVNLSLLTWPYFRELVASMTSRAGIRIPVAPSMNLG